MKRKHGTKNRAHAICGWCGEQQPRGTMRWHASDLMWECVNYQACGQRYAVRAARLRGVP